MIYLGVEVCFLLVCFSLRGIIFGKSRGVNNVVFAFVENFLANFWWSWGGFLINWELRQPTFGTSDPKYLTFT